jgi:hypothetical protein
MLIVHASVHVFVHIVHRNTQRFGCHPRENRTLSHVTESDQLPVRCIVAMMGQ